MKQPIHTKPDKYTRSPLHHKHLAEDVHSDSPRGEKYDCSVLYFMSGDIFNKNIRIHTAEMGFTINMPLSYPLGVTGDAGKGLPGGCEDNSFDCIH